MKWLISSNLFRSFIVVLLIGIVFKFMSKEREEEKTKDLGNVVFKLKKNAKLATYIMCFFCLVILPIISIKPIFKDGEHDLLILNLIFILAGIFLLIFAKEEMIYIDGVFRWKNIFGKSKTYKFDDVIKAKYQEGNGNARIVLYAKNKKKLEFYSYHTNFDWVLKEIKIRKIEIYNK